MCVELPVRKTKWVPLVALLPADLPLMPAAPAGYRTLGIWPFKRAGLDSTKTNNNPSSDPTPLLQTSLAIIQIGLLFGLAAFIKSYQNYCFVRDYPG